MKTTVVFQSNNQKQQQRLQHVEQYRQRVELMHKIAQLNADKTKQLLQTIKLPAIAPEDYYVSNSVSTLVKKVSKGFFQHITFSGKEVWKSD